jgi:Protein of unknown function (DUF3179)
VIAAGLVAFAPAWLIQPFRPQTEAHISVSHVLRRISPWLTIVLLTIVAVLVVKLWRGARWWSRALMVLGFALATLDAWFARQNHFEWMFRPLPNAAYAPAGEAKFVDDADLVLAVERNGEAAAYPIRQLAYHHLVHDTVGRVPIVVTY